MTRNEVISLSKNTLFIRICILPICLLLSEHNAVVLQTAFAVLGILFSIAVSMAISIDLSNVLNKKHRTRFKKGLRSIVFTLTFDLLATSTLILLGLLYSHPILIGQFSFSLSTFGVSSSIISLIRESTSFIKLMHFRDELTERIIQEKEESE